MGFTASDFEDSLASKFSSVSIYTWIDKIANWAQQSHSPLRYCLITTQDPFNKASLKCTGHSGALFFDAVTVVASHYFCIANPKTQAAANAAFTEIYMKLVTSPSIQIDPATRNSLYSRVENDKGNAMESLSLFLLEDSQHDLIWLMVYLVLQISFPANYRWRFPFQ